MEMFVNLKPFLSFISERHKIAVKREQGKPKPWTADPILQSYRFCNVFREWDAVTQWISTNWREPNNDDPDLWFAMTTARLINWPQTLERIGYPVPFRPQAMLRVLRLRKADGNKVFTGAYMIRSDKMPKDEYIVDGVLPQLWAKRKHLRPKPLEPLQAFYERIEEMRGMGSFLTAQVVADMKYAPVFQGAEDWWTFAAPGPGSQRGLSRVVFGHVRQKWNEREWKEQLTLVHEKIGQRIRLANTSYPFHAQDLQNCLCEFDKYERVRLGEGRPRSNFDGK